MYMYLHVHVIASRWSNDMAPTCLDHRLTITISHVYYNKLHTAVRLGGWDILCSCSIFICKITSRQRQVPRRVRSPAICGRWTPYQDAKLYPPRVMFGAVTLNSGRRPSGPYSSIRNKLRNSQDFRTNSHWFSTSPPPLSSPVFVIFPELSWRSHVPVCPHE